MTDKDKIKFAIRYLKKGLKSKRTPPLYEELMNELGFVRNDKVNNLSSVAEVRLANWQKYEKENAELKAENEAKDIQIKELQEQKVYWKESSFDWRHKFFKKDEVKRLVKKDKQLTNAKELIKRLIKVTYGEGWNYSLQVKVEAEKFLKESE